MTGSEIIDGNVNNLCRDISRIDRTIGDRGLHKVFVGISAGIPEIGRFKEKVKDTFSILLSMN